MFTIPMPILCLTEQIKYKRINLNNLFINPRTTARGPPTGRLK
ncbi:Uncharacterized protein ChrSV_4320 [Chromobacterium vaccinii]|nr:Uncharacterized protein ChrSW_4320 [Chromobacterium vaccinii]QND91777.1 Uncharacterized protein ChrSV_4320 [Chromobacterium vaccinii]